MAKNGAAHLVGSDQEYVGPVRTSGGDDAGFAVVAGRSPDNRMVQMCR